MAVAPPRPKGPALNALRAFEAAARRGSFVAAAEELSVTPGAISQHIKAVEAWSGVSLFRRRAHGVELTEAGRQVAPVLADAFDGIGEATRMIREMKPRATLTVAALPSVAQLWLYPRLAAIRAALPGVKLSITAMESPPNLRRDLFDLSLFPRDPEDCPDGVVLAPDEIFPVAAPQVAERVQSTGDLTGETLLNDESWASDWPDWAEAEGIRLPDLSDAPRFSLYSLAVAEAVAGAGVLMGHGFLLEEQIRAGQLIPLHERRHATGRALVLDRPARVTGDLARLIALISGPIPPAFSA